MDHQEDLLLILPDVSATEFSQITEQLEYIDDEQLEYIDENDEHADIASGDRVINDSLINNVLDTTDTNVATAEAETRSSEAEKDSVLQKQFTSLRDRLSTQIKKYGSPFCYRRGDFYDRAPHPVFVLHRSTGSQGGLDPTELYGDVFIWIPNLLPAERSFDESINRSLAHNVVPVNDWTDLPPSEQRSEILTTTASDSVDIEEAASEVLGDFLNIPSSSSPLQAVALAIKTEQRLGESPCLHIIQLRTKTKIYIFKVTDLTSRSDVLPSLRAILTNPSIIKIGHSIRQTLQTISQVFSLAEIVDLLKARNPPILDLGRYAKLKGVVEDPSVSLSALAGVVLKNSFSAPRFLHPWSSTTSLQNEFLRSEIDCQWQIYLSLRSRDSFGLPLQPVQATTHGQLVSLVQGCKPVAEGSIVAQHNGYLDAVMDAQAHTKRINISPSRSLIRISKVLVPGALHSLHGQTMELNS
ncbi:hypothetical protein B0H11DRAFT_2235618 [Mycena galericulata]|nr:hypothetical protein B0H11DRAFT_2235618 [Mycena galericulata]